jgi:hypothetical protein
MTLEGRFSHEGNVKTFVASFAVCFMNIWAISDLQDVESMSTTSVTRGNIHRPSCITMHYLWKIALFL